MFLFPRNLLRFLLSRSSLSAELYDCKSPAAAAFSRQSWRTASKEAQQSSPLPSASALWQASLVSKKSCRLASSHHRDIKSGERGAYAAAAAGCDRCTDRMTTSWTRNNLRRIVSRYSSCTSSKWTFTQTEIRNHFYVSCILLELYYTNNVKIIIIITLMNVIFVSSTKQWKESIKLF